MLVVLALSPAVSADPPGSQPKNPPGKTNRNVPKAQKKEKKTKPPKNLAARAMRMTIENAEFDKMPFEDFVEWLRRTTKANVVVRWRILEQAGVERDRPIILEKKDIGFSKLLRLVFAQLTEDLMFVDLAVKAEGNTLIISTRKDIYAKMIVKVYDIRDLLVVVPSLGGARFTHVDERRYISLGAGKSRTTNNRDERINERVARLIEVITQTIQPLSWKVNGGRGTIAYFKGQLVIRNNIEVHRLFAGVLGER